MRGVDMTLKKEVLLAPAGMMMMMMNVMNEMKRAQEAMWTKTPLVGVVMTEPSALTGLGMTEVPVLVVVV